MDDIEKEIAKIELEISNVNQLEKETENEIRQVKEKIGQNSESRQIPQVPLPRNPPAAQIEESKVEFNGLRQDANLFPTLNNQ